MTPQAPDARSAPPTPWAVWFLGGVAAALALAAFMLWGLNGSRYLIDAIVALCL